MKKIILPTLLLIITNSLIAQTIGDKYNLLSQFLLNQEIGKNTGKVNHSNNSFMKKSNSMVGNSSISGTITENNLGAVENYSIKLIKVESDSYLNISDTFTDEFGVYSFSNLSDGKYVILTGTTSDEYLDYLWKPLNVGGPVLCSGCVKQIDSQFDIQVGESKTVNLIIEKGGVILGSVIDAISQAVALDSLAVKIYSVNSDYNIDSIQDSTTGIYTFRGLPNGNYRIYLTPRVTNDSLFNEYIPQIYNGGECMYCIEKVEAGIGEELNISNFGTLSDINFELSKGAKIEGIVVDETTLTADFPIGGIFVLNEGGNTVAYSVLFNSNDGVYTVAGLLPGRYYIYALTSVTGSFGSITPYQRMLYANKPCFFNNCDVSKGDVVEIGANETINQVDFLLKLGGLIKGNIVDAATGNAPIIDKDLYIQVYDSNENVVGGDRVRPNDQGEYNLTYGIPEGTYTVKIGNTRSGKSAKPYIEEKFDNVECIGLACDLTAGNVDVISGHQTFNINFSLEKGYSISGSIIDVSSGNGIGNINLILYKSINNGNTIKYASFTKSRNIQYDDLGNASLIGSYSISGLPEGDYYLVTNNGSNLPLSDENPKIRGNWVDKLYGDVICLTSTCDISQGSIITVNSANQNVSGIDINLSQGAIISGTVYDDSKQVIEGVNINIFDSNGTQLGQFKTDRYGTYQTTGLIAGSYYLTTSSHELWRDVKYGDDLCTSVCDPLTGDAINLSNQQESNNIDFHLTRIDGDIFVNGFE